MTLAVFPGHPLLIKFLIFPDKIFLFWSLNSKHFGKKLQASQCKSASELKSFTKSSKKSSKVFLKSLLIFQNQIGLIKL